MFILLGKKNPEEIPYYLAWCDVAFLSFANNSLFEMTIPAKLQSYMACGMPIIAVASGETKRIIEEAGCGTCISDRDVEKLVRCVYEIEMSESIVAEWGKKAEQYCKKHYQKKNLFDEMVQMLN